MVFERRTFLLAGVAFMAGCARASQGKPRGVSVWNDFKARFILPEGRVVDSGNSAISHSEGQGYGLLLAEAVGDRQSFDRLLKWTEANLARPHEALFSWRYEPGKGVTDPNNATDGDILIAWALMRAGARWRQPAYTRRAAEIRRDIRRHLVHEQGKRQILLPGLVGFEHADRVTINLSYYVWPALDAFRKADGADQWGKLITDGEQLLIDGRAGPLALPTDWSDIDAEGRVTPARERPARFGFDAIRIPLYLSLGRRQQGADTITRFWRGYADRKAPIPAWVDVQTGETAPYAISEGGCAVVQRVLADGAVACPQNGAMDYYSTVLKALAEL
ncbi:glycosyl hydrolase family 8 [Sphingomonas sp. C3-2]|uniref:glycosyl hydrolase family 8 n=1 Tax=Sphingomonas sp. C3-2 TaxID=3062169 RepID=UPI00294B693E|nr:glycosyl hydrolase family 8 [Sphingomonas sp. C3-2]WOK35985.1 glycosyl hydrolase family 8 [Sphingomonas sp. C3-2]